MYIDPSLEVSYGEQGEGYIEDVTVYSGNPDTNYGSATFCFVGKHPSYGTARTAIRLTGLQSNSIYNALHNAFIDSATLTLRAQTGSTAAATAKFYPLESDSWTETGATWNNIGEYVVDSTGEPMAEGNLLVNTNMTFDLTAFVRDWKIDNAHYPNTLEQGFIMVSSDENTTTTPPTTTIQKRFCSSEISTTSYRPQLTITYHEGVEILSQEQPYRAVGENEIVYVKQGETVNLSASTSPYCGWIYWNTSNTAVGTISSSGAFSASATVCGSTTITVDNGETDSLRYEDSITVYVVPVIPGEYYIETPLQSNRFIEPVSTVSAGATLTVGSLAEDEDNRLVVEFVPDSTFGYYTIKKMVKNSDNTYTPWYLGINTSTNGTAIKYYDDADVTGRRFDIEFRSDTGYYIITPQLSGQWNRSMAANASSPVGTQLTIQNYTEDESYNDEWIFRRVLPLSGDEKTMDKSLWVNNNARHYLNCYSYAINALIDSNSRYVNDYISSTTIDLAGFSSPLDSEEEAYQLLKAGAEYHGFEIQRIEKYEACPDGYYKIALVFSRMATSENNDVNYHFYRQLSNGIWAHREGPYRADFNGSGEVRITDAGGKTIFDVETSNRNFLSDQEKDHLDDYLYFMGYYAVNPRSVIQPSE